METRSHVTLIGCGGRPVSRRALLKLSVLGVGAVGVGSLSACMALPPQAAAPAAPGGPPTMARRNLPKTAALYQDFPNGAQRCGRCRHFLPPSGCEIVAGQISPRGWCRYFEAMT